MSSEGGDTTEDPQGDQEGLIYVEDPLEDVLEGFDDDLEKKLEGVEEGTQKEQESKPSKNFGTELKRLAEQIEDAANLSETSDIDGIDLIIEAEKTSYIDLIAKIRPDLEIVIPGESFFSSFNRNLKSYFNQINTSIIEVTNRFGATNKMLSEFDVPLREARETQMAMGEYIGYLMAAGIKYTKRDEKYFLVEEYYKVRDMLEGYPTSLAFNEVWIFAKMAKAVGQFFEDANMTVAKLIKIAEVEEQSRRELVTEKMKYLEKIRIGKGGNKSATGS